MRHVQRVWALAFAAALAWGVGEARAETRYIASFSTASLRVYKGLADEWGFDVPPILTKAGLDAAFRFSQQGVRDDEPVGLYLLAGEVLPAQRAVFALPVNQNVAAIAWMLEWGARPVQGKTDTVMWGGTTIRRTPGYLIVGGTPATIERVGDQTLRSLYRGNQAVLRLQGDLDGLRAAVPHQYRQVTDGLRDGVKAQGHTVNALLGPAVDALTQKVKFADFSLDRMSQDYKAELELQGFKRWEAGNLAKPKFPGTPVARVDVVYGDAARGAWPAEMLAAVLDGAVKDRFLSEPERQAMDSAFQGIVKLLLVGDGVSLAVDESQGEPVLMIVTQRRAATDLKAEVANLVRPSAGAARGPVSWVDVGYETPTGLPVHRLHPLTAQADPSLHIDVAQHERMTVATISRRPVRVMDAMLPMKTTGRLNTGVTGEADLPRLLTVAKKLPGGPLEGADAAALEKVVAKLARKVIRFGARFNGDTLVLDVTLPVKLLQVAQELRDLKR